MGGGMYKRNGELLFSSIWEKYVNSWSCQRDKNSPGYCSNMVYQKAKKCRERRGSIYIWENQEWKVSWKTLKINSEQKEYLVNVIEEKPGIVLDEMMEVLASQFTDLGISRFSLQKYVTAHFGMSLEKALFAERNSDTKIEVRFNWLPNFWRLI